jgi:hypothetical protein
MGDHDEGYDPIADAEEKAEYARDAAMDAFYDKHPPQVLNIRIQMDLAQGLWLEHIIENDEQGETVDDLDPSHDIDEFMATIPLCPAFPTSNRQPHVDLWPGNGG